MPKALDISNQQFGKLTALYKLQSKKGKTYWRCRCECGKEKDVQTGHLVNGLITSCASEECRGFSNPLLKNSIKKCLICNKEFESNNINRLYCFDCSPSGVNAKDRQRLLKRKIKEILIDYKGGKCCICGYNKCQGALQFHHLNPKEKEFNLSHVNLNDTDCTLEILKQEVDKCILVCANCHFEIHFIDDGIENL